MTARTRQGDQIDGTMAQSMLTLDSPPLFARTIVHVARILQPHLRPPIRLGACLLPEPLLI